MSKAQKITTKLRRFALVGATSSLMLLATGVAIAQSLIGPPIPDISCGIPAGPSDFVSVAITRLVEFVETEIDGDDINPRNKGDFYAVATINGATQSSFAIDGGSFDFCTGGIFTGCIGPSGSDLLAEYGLDRLWQFNQALPLEVGMPRPPVNITIEIWDDDPGGNPDDRADLKPGVGEALNLVLDPNTGQVSGDIDSTQACSRGMSFIRQPSNPVEICLEVGGSLSDSDGDSLYDVWEACGFDPDESGPAAPINLPAFGADPMHKDLFFELDWVAGAEPRRADIRELKSAFAVAPSYAGIVAAQLPNGVRAKLNPDGRPGINLWVDTGSLTDANGNLVGDDLGGGSEITPVDALCPPQDGNVFKIAKARNFELGRNFIFRYGISAQTCPGADAAAWGELGGDDLLLRANGSSIFMHELGHTLNLRHGGNEDHNCKPNYVSVMNYVHQNGIPQVLARSPFVSINVLSSGLADYSPARFGVEDNGGLRSCEDGQDNGPDGFTDAQDPDCLKRGNAPLIPLKEDDLDESVILDQDDPVNHFVFVNGRKKLVVWPVNGDRDGDRMPDGVDWNGNGRPPFAEDGVGLLTTVTPPISLIPGTCSDMKDNGPDGFTDDEDDNCLHEVPRPSNIDNVIFFKDCKNDSNDSELNGFNDWAVISVPFRQFPASAVGSVEPLAVDDEPTVEELEQLEQELNTTDLAIFKESQQSQIEVGADLTYILTIINKGPNPASRVELADALPSGIAHKRDNGRCTVSSGSEPAPTSAQRPIADGSGVRNEGDTITCDLGALMPLEQREIEITVSTDGIPNNVGSTLLMNLATVQNVSESAGPDPQPSDNFANVTTTLVGMTPDDRPRVKCNGLTPNIVGTSGNDFLVGTADSDIVHGLPGDDLIRGLRGNDIICGGRGNDRLFGQRGGDLLLGQRGNDELAGGRGEDTCMGGHGNDTITRCE